MAQNTRELRRRIKSTKSIRQITKAMEMIAASKMRKAQLAALASRSYAQLAWNMLEQLGRAKIEGYEHPFLGSVSGDQNETAREDARNLLVVITTNRGLCGALNTQVIQKALSHIPYIVSSDKEGPKAYGIQLTASNYIAVGRKAQRGLARQNAHVVAAFDAFETAPTFEEVRPIAKIAMDEFATGRVSAVTLVYADFISTLRYEPRARTILPITSHTQEERPVPPMPASGGSGSAVLTVNSTQGPTAEYLFEPSPAEVLDELLPRLVELQVYQAILENLASEHSARMVAMNTASDAATDLIRDFTLTYNSLRQTAITRELADIVGGRMALKH